MGAYVAATTTTSKVGFRQFSEERPCTVTITVHGPTKRKFDAPNFWPTVKALQDGMTDAKLWTDDNGSVIKATTFKHGEGKSGHDGYKFKIEIKPYKEKKA
jgi:crossover junction endodeoxyribonuclease RusA